jgi:hypothetical protein
LVVNNRINCQVFDPNSRPYGKPYSEWCEKWIKWGLSIPRMINPITDNTGENCAKMQEGPVWFLAGTFGTSAKRKCTIPSTKAIFFPIIEKECSFAEEGEQLKTEEGLVARAELLMDLVSFMEVTVDGIYLQNLKQYRARSKVFDLTFPQDNVYGVKPGPTRSVTDGYWVFLKPLPIGKHIIQFVGESSIPAGPIARLARRYVNVKGNLFKTEVTYHLKIG